VILHESEDREADAGTRGRVAIVLDESPLSWFCGYQDEPERSVERFAGNGRWYLTGDSGHLDDEGYFYFSSRDDDVIIMAGYRIGPSDVESVLAQHPAVAESAVIAVPDEVRGEVMEAVVVLHDPGLASDALRRELQQWVKTRYAAHAYPRGVQFIDALPKTPSGKVQRFLLKQQRRAAIELAKAGQSS
jgi:acetyl-CoA synthetase